MGNFCSVSTCNDLFSHCIQCFLSKAAYMSQLEDNFIRLQSDLQKLIHTRNDVMRRVIVDEQSLKMKRTDQVQGWLSRVQAAENQVEELQQLKDEQTQKLCLGGYCSNNCKSSYNLGKRVYKMLQVVTTLKTEGDFKNVADKMPEDPVDEMPIHPTIVSLQSTFDKVLNLSCNGLIEFPLGISRLVSIQHLDLLDTKIKELPEELKALANLRCLNLENMFSLHCVPRRLISSFAKLHVFRLLNFVQFSSEDSVLFGGGEYLVEELLCLKYLKALSIHLKGSCALGKFLKSQKLHSCTQFLQLEGLTESLAVLSLTVKEEIESLNPFAKLECLILHNLRRLKSIYWKPLPFPHLKEMMVLRCPSLEKLPLDFNNVKERKIVFGVDPHLSEELKRDPIPTT
ncbi:hypothetical protein EZV62_004204 [Acer yangbiense]|uniref:Rx N-terminal domain-containing protein n=1 Tax=Acer yangbiense TaxID=1000413 RepID=A0A5C7IJM2_9ROSI|nr:hypothetical protein EZV62_004204 [Acer yangbiense]